MEKGEERSLESNQAGQGDGKQEAPQEPIPREEGTKTLGETGQSAGHGRPRPSLMTSGVQGRPNPRGHASVHGRSAVQ